MSSHPNDPFRPATTSEGDLPPLTEPYTPTPTPSDLDPVAPEYPPTRSGGYGAVETPATPSRAQDAASSAQDAASSVAKPASDVKDAAQQAGRDVAQTARQEAGEVVAEAKHQGRKVLDESLSEFRTQASQAQSRLAETVSALSDELGAMAGAQDANGPLAGLASQGQEMSERAAAWLRDNEPDQALAGIRRYAARNPWTFLAIAAGAGLLAGRLARGLQASAAEDAEFGTPVRRETGYVAPRSTYAPEDLDASPQSPYVPRDLSGGGLG